MGVAQAVELEGKTFRTKGDATAYFSKMLAKYAVGAEVSGDDAALLSQLLKRHKCYEVIVEGGVDSFTTMISEEKSKCFAVLREDGSLCGFSYHKCITPR